MDKFLRKISTLLVYLFLICNSILVLGPVIWTIMASFGFAPIFPDTCYHLTHYWPAAADIPVASDNP
ncbi:sugar ABC transporter permease, partial [Escherichia coli]|nr:sugar ABC transporter permease [Escherichia coli]